MDAHSAVTRQLGRAPRGPWRVSSWCSFGYPMTIATAPVTDEGEPFPTLYYLTCPHLVAAVSQLESAGEVGVWRARLAAEPVLALRMRAADVAYREARAFEAGGCDPTPELGTAGQRDALATKCLHAHVAAFLAGIEDPVGEAVITSVQRECEDFRCEEVA